MEQFGSGLVAGISVPNTPIITDALGYAQRLSEPYLFNHAVRSWLFAICIARAKNIDYDPEVVAIGTILHDIGLTDSVTGPKRFEVNGADAARAFVAERGLSDRRAQLIWDLVALNSTASIALYKEPEVAVGTMGIGLDWGGEFLCRLYLHSIHACKRCVERGQSSVPYYRAKRVRVGTDEGASL